MNRTHNYNLGKPTYEDPADIYEININMDNIDSIIFTNDEQSQLRDTELETWIRTHINALEIDHPDGSVTAIKIKDSAVIDSKIGNRTINDPESDTATHTGLLTAIINKITSAIRTLRAGFTAHTGNISNPHSVTAVQAGAAPTSHASAGTTYGISSAASYGHAIASSAVPLVAGTASAGTDNGKYAREGHIHPVQTTITGNAGSATILATSRTLSWTGDASGSLNFNGSTNVSAILTLANSGITAGTYLKVTVDTKGRVTAGINPSTLSGVGITDAYTKTEITTLLSAKEALISTGSSSQYWNGLKAWTDFATSVRAAILTGLSTSTNTAITATDSLLVAIGKLQAQITATAAGNVTSASKWYTARTLSLTGDGTASMSVDGSTNVSTVLTLTSVITATTLGETANKTLTFGGTFITLQATVDAKGRITALNARTMTMPATPTAITGNAGSATVLATARTIQTNLASTSAASFNGSANTTPGVTGILPITNGGTGNTTGKAATADKLNYTGY